MEVTVKYSDIDIVYIERDNEWEFELRGRTRRAESLAKAKEAIDKVPETRMSEDRPKVLLRAAYDMLKKTGESFYVLSPFETTVFYDGADCDGSCLMEDIAHELELDKDEQPLKNPSEGSEG